MRGMYRKDKPMTSDRPQHLTPPVQRAYAQLFHCPREGLQHSTSRNSPQNAPDAFTSLVNHLLSTCYIVKPSECPPPIGPLHLSEPGKSLPNAGKPHRTGQANQLIFRDMPSFLSLPDAALRMYVLACQHTQIRLQGPGRPCFDG